MAILINEPLFINGKYVDEVLNPLETFADLKVFATGKMFDGLEVLVNNNGLPVKFLYQSKVAKNRFNWIIKELPVFPTYESLTGLSDEIVTTLGARSRAFYIGLEAIVQAGESGNIERYIVTEVNAGMPTWTLVVSDGGRDASTNVEAVINMLNNDGVGNVVYTTDTMYSYETVDASGNTAVVYTENKEEAEGKPGYVEYPKALYIVTSDASGNTVLSDVIINNAYNGTSIKIIGDDIE